MQARNLFKGNGNIWKFLIRQILYILAGGVLYFIISMLGSAYFEPAIRNVTFRPATVILVLFGILYGPWVGLLAGIAGKGLTDFVSGWGFYWNGILAYGLIGFIPGFFKMALDELRTTRNILKAIGVGALAVLTGALFFSTTEARFSDLNLPDAIRNFFWPEFLGNLTVVVILLPLLIMAIVVIDRKRNSWGLYAN